MPAYYPLVQGTLASFVGHPYTNDYDLTANAPNQYAESANQQNFQNGQSYVISGSFIIGPAGNGIIIGIYDNTGVLMSNQYNYGPTGPTQGAFKFTSKLVPTKTATGTIRIQLLVTNSTITCFYFYLAQLATDWEVSCNICGKAISIPIVAGNSTIPQNCPTCLTAWGTGSIPIVGNPMSVCGSKGAFTVGGKH